MEMTGSRLLPVPQQQVWDALNDLAILQACVPGCESMELMDDGAFSVSLKVKIGPVAARFKGRITLMDAVPPEGYSMAFEGQGGVAGFGKGQARVRLVPTESVCELNYTVTASVGGKVAQLGQRLIDGAARSMADGFFERFENEVVSRRAQPHD